jgi:hypothetical protein
MWQVEVMDILSMEELIITASKKSLWWGGGGLLYYSCSKYDVNRAQYSMRRSKKKWDNSPREDWLQRPSIKKIIFVWTPKNVRDTKNWGVIGRLTNNHSPLPLRIFILKIWKEECDAKNLETHITPPPPFTLGIPFVIWPRMSVIF